MDDTLSKELKDHMEKSIKALEKDLNGIRTGRASSSLLDGIKIDYYGTNTPLNQIATISTPESRLITIQPWDINIIGDIEKTIQRSELGLNPMNDGKIIRISIPSLSEERRKDLVKVVKKMVEDYKVEIRNHRRNVNEKLKKMKQDKDISEDDYFKQHEVVQRITDEYVTQCDKVFTNKEKEIIEF
jgi:ribosome recycling factor